MGAVSQKIINYHMDCSNVQIDCETCPAGKIITIYGERIMLCALLSIYKEALFDKIRENLLK